MLPARMRSNAGWSDACILNVSSGGLLIYSNAAADPGATIEIRRGGQMVAARVVWRQNQRIGLRSCNPVPVEEIISDQTAASAVLSCGEPLRLERRRQPRNPDRSRAQGRAIEFLFVATLGSAVAAWAAMSVHEALAAPMSAIGTALDPD